jgi:hypothetical protein
VSSGSSSAAVALYVLWRSYSTEAVTAAAVTAAAGGSAVSTATVCVFACRVVKRWQRLQRECIYCIRRSCCVLRLLFEHKQ